MEYKPVQLRLQVRVSPIQDNPEGVQFDPNNCSFLFKILKIPLSRFVKYLTSSIKIWFYSKTVIILKPYIFPEIELESKSFGRNLS